MYGEVPPRLDIGVTAATAFSSQSVMTLAKVGDAAAVRAAARSVLRILACMMSSSRSATRVSENRPARTTTCGRYWVPPEVLVRGSALTLVCVRVHETHAQSGL